MGSISIHLPRVRHCTRLLGWEEKVVEMSKTRFPPTKSWLRSWGRRKAITTHTRSCKLL